ncbi:TPA: zinc-binding alcohol dehydrogenase family protein [Streptococcus suis]|nr:zinc-binding alcohol dehydrogenase family protein [Streptococcus suis]HEM3724143.1 zinc-binding alcohol dehydrogenase family protein [Streptococcus suis]
MKALAIINTELLPEEGVRNKEMIDILGTTVTSGIVEVTRPNFDVKNPQNDDFILIHVDAFSCNYRDKALIVKEAIKMNNKESSAKPVSFFGSDFVGTITAVGASVTDLKIGMRVIPNCYYPYKEYNNIAIGVVTNEASKGWLKLHKSKVLPIPDNMDDYVAASFSIGAQTSTSMIRRCHIKSTDKILVTSARSNTSIFIIKSLLTAGYDVTALTTTDWSGEELDFISPAKVVKIERGLKSWKELELGKFDVIFDPFYDLNLLNCIPNLNFNGRYITCGFKNQHSTFEEKTDDARLDKFNLLMIQAMINNLYIIGNCIGTTEDLRLAISNYDSNKPPIHIDKIVDVYHGAEFLDSTYNIRSRFGKVVMTYKD